MAQVILGQPTDSCEAVRASIHQFGSRGWCSNCIDANAMMHQAEAVMSSGAISCKLVVAAQHMSFIGNTPA